MSWLSWGHFFLLSDMVIACKNVPSHLFICFLWEQTAFRECKGLMDGCTKVFFFFHCIKIGLWGRNKGYCPHLNDAPQQCVLLNGRKAKHYSTSGCTISQSQASCLKTGHVFISKNIRLTLLEKSCMTEYFATEENWKSTLRLIKWLEIQLHMLTYINL